VEFPTDATVLVVAHCTPRSTTQCGVSVRAVCAVRAVRCFGSRDAVFRDGCSPRTARGVRGALRCFVTPVVTWQIGK